jgi:hypothetical protein
VSIDLKMQIDRTVSAKIEVRRDSIPYGEPLDTRHRIWVFGRDKIRFDELMKDKQSAA